MSLKEEIKSILKKHYFSRALEITLKAVEQDVLKELEPYVCIKLTDLEKIANQPMDEEHPFADIRSELAKELLLDAPQKELKK